jgi:hypothetical protein
MPCGGPTSRPVVAAWCHRKEERIDDGEQGMGGRGGQDRRASWRYGGRRTAEESRPSSGVRHRAGASGSPSPAPPALLQRQSRGRRGAGFGSCRPGRRKKGSRRRRRDARVYRGCLPWPPPSSRAPATGGVGLSRSRAPAAARRRERSKEEALGREEMRAGRIWVPLLGCLAPPAGSSCGGGGRWGGRRLRGGGRARRGIGKEREGVGPGRGLLFKNLISGSQGVFVDMEYDI